MKKVLWILICAFVLQSTYARSHSSSKHSKRPLKTKRTSKRMRPIHADLLSNETIAYKMSGTIQKLGLDHINVRTQLKPTIAMMLDKNRFCGGRDASCFDKSKRLAKAWYGAHPRGTGYQELLTHANKSLSKLNGENPLPQEILYLPIVESELNNKAQSPVGARGLWQFMPETARQYGMKVHPTYWGRDDRTNFSKSTLAAIEMFGDLHKQFKHWGLALAAYNWGSGNVRQAISRSGSRHMKHITGHMPSETRAYPIRLLSYIYIIRNARALGLMS